MQVARMNIRSCGLESAHCASLRYGDQSQSSPTTEPCLATFESENILLLVLVLILVFALVLIILKLGNVKVPWTDPLCRVD